MASANSIGFFLSIPTISIRLLSFKYSSLKNNLAINSRSNFLVNGLKQNLLVASIAFSKSAFSPNIREGATPMIRAI